MLGGLHNLVMNARREKYFETEFGAARTHRVCDHEGCDRPGEYRAPKSRDKLDEYYWFCLDHVREYNTAWNYYAGLDEEEVEECVRKDICWDRPTWSLGGRGARAFVKTASRGFRDDFGFFDEEKAEAEVEHVPPAERMQIRKSLRVLDLEWPCTIDEVRNRYKQLAKTLHPDANGGDPDAEERLKRVNQAYSQLKTSSLARPPKAAAV